MVKVIATNGTDRTRVKIYHWWPGRQWEGPCPIPAYMIHRAVEKNTVYLTVAYIGDLAAGTHYPTLGVAECCPKDIPERKLGRRIALGRLARELEPVGWTLEGAA